MIDAKRDACLAMPALRERGWTPAMVKRLLGPPDRVKPNPVFRSAAPMPLFAQARVAVVEASPEFAAARVKAEARSRTATKIAEARRRALIEEIGAMTIHVRIVPAETLLRGAIDAYNDWNGERYDFEPATRASDPLFLERIRVNHVRHRLTRYDHELEQLAGRVGVADASRLVRRKVYAAIAEAYPHLAVECDRQLVHRGEEPLAGTSNRLAFLAHAEDVLNERRVSPAEENGR